MKRVAVFVDVQNIYYTTRQAFNAHFDYNVFWRQVTDEREVVKATAFAVGRDDEKQKLNITGHVNFVMPAFA